MLLHTLSATSCIHVYMLFSVRAFAMQTFDFVNGTITVSARFPSADSNYAEPLAWQVESGLDV